MIKASAKFINVNVKSNRIANTIVLFVNVRNTQPNSPNSYNASNTSLPKQIYRKPLIGAVIKTLEKLVISDCHSQPARDA